MSPLAHLKLTRTIVKLFSVCQSLECGAQGVSNLRATIAKLSSKGTQGKGTGYSCGDGRDIEWRLPISTSTALACARRRGGGLRTIAKVCESLFCPPFADFLYLEILLTFLIKWFVEIYDSASSFDNLLIKFTYANRKSPYKKKKIRLHMK